MQKPDVDHIDGLSPAISIEQKTTSRTRARPSAPSPRSTTTCACCSRASACPIRRRPGCRSRARPCQQMVDRVLALPEGTRLYLLAPIVRGRKGEYRKELAELQKKGFQRVKVNGTFYEIADAPKLDKKFKHDIDVVVDRIVVRGDIAHAARRQLRDRAGAGRRHRRLPSSRDKPLPDSETKGANKSQERDARAHHLLAALCLSGLRLHHRRDRAAAVLVQRARRRLPEVRRPRHRAALRGRPGRAGPDAEPEARARSFPGRRPAAPRPTTSRRWRRSPSTSRSRWRRRGASCRRRCRTPSFTARAMRRSTSSTRTGCAIHDAKPFEGVIGNIERRCTRDGERLGARGAVALPATHPCEACGGYRLKPQALAVKIDGKHIGEVSRLSIRAANAWFAELPEQAHRRSRTRSPRASSRRSASACSFLIDVGLDYLTLSRASGTLSGGESQRIRLASQIGSGLTGVLYVLDEPSIGLHQRDNARLLETLKHLRDIGNTVIVVEHDEDAILQADHVVDIGPGAGIHGGQIVARGHAGRHHGRPRKPHRAISHRARGRSRCRRRGAKIDKGSRSQCIGARGNNLKDVTAEIPLGCFTAITGVSGGGKSTLLIETLYKAARAQAQRRARDACAHRHASTARTPRQGHRHRPVAHRPHAALEPGDLHRRVHARSATGSPGSPRPRRAATSRAASPSTSRAGAARPARATASSRSRCTSCPTSTSPATSARASATIARRWRSSSRASPSPTCST